MTTTIVDPATALRDAEDAARVRVATFIEPRDDWQNWPLVKGGQGRSGSEVASNTGQVMLLIAAVLIVLAVVCGVTSHGLAFTVFLLLAIGCAVVALVCGFGSASPANYTTRKHIDVKG